MALEKAKIVIKEGPDKDKEIPVMFNPSEYKISKNINYNTQNVQGKEDKPITYKNGDPARLEVELFFDCDIKYNSKQEKVDEQNVRKYTDRILKLLIPISKTDSTSGVPASCQFVWGTFIFAGYISSATQTFTRFTSEGIPIRATVSLTIIEKADDTANNITDETIEKYGAIETSSNDELCNVGKTPEEWRKIADANGILNPRSKDSSGRLNILTKDVKNAIKNVTDDVADDVKNVIKDVTKGATEEIKNLAKDIKNLDVKEVTKDIKKVTEDIKKTTQQIKKTTQEIKKVSKNIKKIFLRIF